VRLGHFKLVGDLGSFDGGELSGNGTIQFIDSNGIHVDALEFGLAKLLLVILLVNCPLQSKQQ